MGILKKHIDFIILFLICFSFYSCRKDLANIAPGTRLQKIIYTGVPDGFNQPCSTCYMYIQFDYDSNNRLVKVIDSSANLINSGPSARKYTYFLFYDNRGRVYWIDTEYDRGANTAALLIYFADSLAYNSQNQVIKKWNISVNPVPYTPSGTHPPKGFQYNSQIDVYQYDSKGRLIFDSTNATNGLSVTFPVQVTYSDYDNATDVSIPGVATGINGSVYIYPIYHVRSTFDNYPNPFRDIGFIGYFVTQIWGSRFSYGYHALGTANPLEVVYDLRTSSQTRTNKYEYTYYSNGFLKTRKWVLDADNKSDILERYIYE